MVGFSLHLFTEEDLAEAFNEWIRRDREDPKGTATHMDTFIKQHNNEGEAISAMVFSILHDLKEEKKNK